VNAEADRIGAVDDALLKKLKGVLPGGLVSISGLYIELGRIQRGNLLNLPKVALLNPHPNPILHIGIKLLNYALPIMINNVFKNLNPFHFKPNPILHLIL
jgi:hypothetical protein